MDPRLLDYYNNELQHIRKMAGEFADAYPNIAGRLALKNDDNSCPDPYVERLLEGFSYLSARVQVKLDASFPRFTSHLLEVVYPHYLAPTPSMTVVQFQPELTEESYSVKKETPFRSELAKGEETACTYRTCHDLTLWPLELTEVNYLAGSSTVEKTGVPVLPKTEAAIRLRLKSTVKFSELKSLDKLGKSKNLDEISFYLHGMGDLPMQIYEQLLANTIGMVVQPVNRPITWQQVIKNNPILAQGFDENEALLPYTARSFQGYRLLQEYFAFHQRYLFIKLTQLQSVM
jgi:type VI secretion system protein ImpG